MFCLIEIEAGRGYWVKSAQDIDLEILDAVVSASDMVLYPGWNLIGLPIENSMPFNQALAGVPFLEGLKWSCVLPPS